MTLERQAEEARLAGRISGPFGDSFTELTGRAQQLREGLFREGALQSSEVSQGFLDKLAEEKAGRETDPMVMELTTANETLKKIEEGVKADRKFT